MILFLGLILLCFFNCISPFEICGIVFTPITSHVVQGLRSSSGIRAFGFVRSAVFCFSPNYGCTDVLRFSLFIFCFICFFYFTMLILFIFLNHYEFFSNMGILESLFLWNFWHRLQFIVVEIRENMRWKLKFWWNIRLLLKSRVTFFFWQCIGY